MEISKIKVGEGLHDIMDANAVRKVEGAGLMTDAEKEKLGELPTNEELEEALSGYYTKVDVDAMRSAGAVVLNDGDAYGTSGQAEADAAGARYAGNPKVNIMLYRYSGTQRGIGNGVIEQCIYRTDGAGYECKQVLFLGGNSYKRVISLSSAPGADGLFSVTTVGAWALQQDTQSLLAGKADKDGDAVEGNLGAFDSGGNPVDSGIAKSDITAMKSAVEELLLGSHDHMAAAWTKEQSSPAAVAKLGDAGLFNYDFFLIDHTRNTEEFSVPVGKLKRNNILRFEDGEFAPAVGITQAMADECAANDLYMNGSLYAEAGKFDAKDFYENHCSWEEDGDGVVRLHVATLHKGSATGDEPTHYLMPWETTETKYSVMLGVEHSLFYLQNVTGTSGKVWNFISTVRKSWDGRNAIELEPTAFAPAPVAVIIENGVRKSRSFFFAYDGESAVYGNGSAGDNGGLVTMFRNTGKTFPATSVMTQISSMQYARNNNSDATKPFPFAEGGWNVLNAFYTYLEIKYGTRALHAATMFGSGISSNDSCTNETSWLSNGGVRARKVGGSAWEYRTWSAAPGVIRVDGTGKAASAWTSFANSYHAKEACMESQIAASVAVEAGIAEGEAFEVYGETYTWGSVNGAANIEHGHMNAVIRSVRKGTVHAYDANGVATDFEVEASLRMSLYEGANISGDIYAYWGGGLEVVGTSIGGASGHSGDHVEVYFEPKQENWITDTDVTHNDGSDFAAQAHYDKIGEGVTLGDGYSLADMEMSPWSIKHGGGLTSGMAHYDYAMNYWSTTVGARVRIGVRFRGHAYSGLCSPRYLYASSSAGTTYPNYGGSAQVRLPDGAAPLQAE